MAFDPSIISQIGTMGGDPVGAKMKAFQLKDMVDQNTLNALKLRAAKKEEEQSNTLEQLSKSYDIAKSEDRAKMASELGKRGQPELGMKVMKLGQDLDSGEVQNKLNRLTVAEKQLDFANQQIDSILSVVMPMKTATKIDPRTGRQIPAYTDAEIQGRITGLLPTVLKNIQDAPDDILPADLKKQAMAGFSDPSKITYDSLLEHAEKNEAGRKQITAAREQMAAADTHRNVESEIKTREHKEARESAAGPVAPPERDLLGALVEKGVPLPAGFRNKEFQKATLQGLIKRHPDMSSDQIADLVLKGKERLAAEMKEVTTAAGIAGRVAVGGNELESFAPAALKASKAVPRGRFMPFTRLMQLGQKNISDPNLKELYGRTIAVLNAYDIVAARGGTDKEKRQENRAQLETADSPAAYERALSVMVNEVQIAKGAARKAEGLAPESAATDNDPLGIR
jgi:hypothetical protein